MPDNKVIEFDTFEIAEPGIGSLAGSPGFLGIILDGNFTLCVAVLANNDTYIGFTEGYLDWTGTALQKYNDWPLYFAGNSTPFSGYYDSISTEIKTQICDNPAEQTSTYLRYDLPTVSLPTKGEDLPYGYMQVKKCINWELEGNYRVYYLGFPATNEGGNENLAYFTSTKILFNYKSPVFNLDYYPFRIFNNSWPNAKSCNRTGGYVKRMQANDWLDNYWIDRKNTVNNQDKSTIFLKSATGFDIIAPRIGIE